MIHLVVIRKEKGSKDLMSRSPTRLKIDLLEVLKDPI